MTTKTTFLPTTATAVCGTQEFLAVLNDQRSKKVVKVVKVVVNKKIL